MSDAMIIYKAIIKMMKFFPLVAPVMVGGLAYISVDERREVNERTKG